MAPEQYSGQYDARSDQYAFCLVAWEAFFGDPFDVRGRFERVRAKLRGPQDLATAGPGLPPAWVTALRRGLSPDPQDRFASMRDLIAAVRPPPRRPVLRALAVAAITVTAAAGYLLPDAPPLDPAPTLVCGAPLTVPLHQAMDRRLDDAATLLRQQGAGLAYARADQVEREARALVAPPLAARALAIMGEASRLGGNAEHAQQLLARVVSTESGACADDVVMAAAVLLHIHTQNHDREAARRWLDADATQAAMQTASPEARSRLAIKEAGLAIEVGDPQAAVGHARRAHALLESLPEEAPQRLESASQLGIMLTRAGQLAEAVAVLRPALDAARRAEAERQLPVLHGVLGLALFRMNEPEAAIPHLRTAYERLREERPIAALEFGQSLVTAYAASGKTAEGRPLVSPLRELATEIVGTWSYEVLAIDRADALLDAVDDRYDIAIAKLVGVLGRAEVLFGEGHTGTATIHADLAAVYKKRGDLELSAQHAALGIKP